MSKRRRLSDELLGLLELQEMREFLKKDPSKNPPNKTGWPKIEGYKLYFILVLLYPFVYPTLIGMLKVSSLVTEIIISK